MQLIENFKHVVLENYANFEGRARRREYWMYALAQFILVYGVIILGILLMSISNTLGGIVIGIAYLILFAILIPSLAVAIRRMHDVGKSGWYLWIPIYNIILAVTEGDQGSNEYGPDPKGGVAIEDFGKEEILEN